MSSGTNKREGRFWVNAARTRPGDQRARILSTALDLMSSRGVAATSMRDLANACGLNVSTLYHYFGSKADLVRAVFSERRYAERLGEDRPQLNPDLPAADRLTALLRFLWEGARAEEPVWRLLITESIHGDEAVQAEIGALVDALDASITAWLAELVPELGADTAADPATVARLIHAQLFSLMIEHLALGTVDAERATGDLAQVVFGR